MSEQVYTFVLDFLDCICIIAALYDDRKRMVRQFKKAADTGDGYEQKNLKQKVDRADRLLDMFTEALEKKMK
jgi:hypothetical protein